LQTFWKNDHQRLVALPRHQQRRCAARAVEAALAGNGLTAPTVSLSDLAAQVQRQDEAGWYLQDADDQAGYLREFRKARALAAVLSLRSDDDPSETIYEAINSLKVLPEEPLPFISAD
jgi:hypothetical protein